MIRSSFSNRSAVLVLYRKLFRTAERTFEGDERGIFLAHDKIRSEFKKNRDLNSIETKEQLSIGRDAEQYLRESVLQAQVKGNRYVLNVKDEHLRSSMEMPVLAPGECYQPFK
ncbi:hypothetical protein LOD99_13742 [Oopsacas minuta]|uniref:Complex III assembly factor LYRM7 n=1 Tax=Oopsacas minuta TaxID=111878 RepID=A0AAV7KIM4_9METZ|nr:hypothetical protein LOD99_13742 [Oopsacas minuta]